MSMTNHDIVTQWLEKAKNDLIVAEHVFINLHPKQIEIACYHCQQSAEKALKAYIQLQGVHPPKTHNLIMLQQMCSDYDEKFEGIEDACGELTVYGIVTRYPDEMEITEQNARTAIQKANSVYGFAAAIIEQGISCNHE